MHGGIDPLLLLAVILVAGLGVGALARRIHLPAVTGQILVGVALGATGLPFFSHEAMAGMHPVTNFALGLIAVTVGSHLHLAKLRNAYRRLLVLVLLEVTLTPVLVFATLRVAGGLEWGMSLLLAAMAVSTAPATVVALVKETRSKGMFVKTLVAAVALNNMACIALFELAHVVVGASLDPAASQTLAGTVIAPLRALLLSAGLGGGVGIVTVIATRRTVRTDQLATVSMIAILLTSGLADFLGLSSLLSCMFLGVAFANLAPDKDEVGHGVFADFEHGIHAAFFTLAGLELDFRYLLPGGALALLLVGARLGGKVLAGRLAMRWAGATERTRKYLGFALVPQAGLAVGLILLIQSNPTFAPLADLFLAVGVTAVTFNEIIGPVMTRMALARSGDFGKDRARLIDFISEENILTNLRATSKEEAIGKLVDLLVRSHPRKIDRDTLLASVLEREQEMSTCIGEGLAIPHGILDEGEEIYGAMAVSSEGLPFDTPDGVPIHCLVLLATPPSRRDHHLEVLAALARAIGSDRNIQRQVYHARSPAHVCEILHAEEGSEDFNYFLEDDGVENPGDDGD